MFSYSIFTTLDALQSQAQGLIGELSIMQSQNASLELRVASCFAENQQLSGAHQEATQTIQALKQEKTELQSKVSELMECLTATNAEMEKFKEEAAALKLQNTKWESKWQDLKDLVQFDQQPSEKNKRDRQEANASLPSESATVQKKSRKPITWAEKIVACEEAVQANPNDPVPHFELGHTLHKAKNYPKALDAFKMAHEKGHDEKDWKLWFYIAFAYASLKKFEEAEYFATKSVDCDHKQGISYELLSKIQIDRGDLNNAKGNIEKAKSLGADVKEVEAKLSRATKK